MLDRFFHLVYDDTLSTSTFSCNAAFTPLAITLAISIINPSTSFGVTIKLWPIGVRTSVISDRFSSSDKLPIIPRNVLRCSSLGKSFSLIYLFLIRITAVANNLVGLSFSSHSFLILYILYNIVSLMFLFS